MKIEHDSTAFVSVKIVLETEEQLVEFFEMMQALKDADICLHSNNAAVYVNRLAPFIK
ncbi:MAG: hypothetical protein ACRCVT_07735 [Leadbetterella sp.]